MARGAECWHQSCAEVDIYSWPANIYNGPYIPFTRCTINGNLTNDQDEVITDPLRNSRSHEITMVHYNHSRRVTFIPNSLFLTFTNLDYLFISSANGFETLKPEYLRNAKKLKRLHIYTNSMRRLNANLFVEANNLEHINFAWNSIESIHRLAFNGLPNLQGVYIDYNKVKFVHPKTFSSFTKLNILAFQGTYGFMNCIGSVYMNANQRIPEIEGKIARDCTYSQFPDEVAAQKLIEDKNRTIQFNQTNNIIQDVQPTRVNNSTVKVLENPEMMQKFGEMHKKMEEIEAKINNQEAKRVKELAEQEKKFEKMMTDQQEEFDTKIDIEKTEMDAKLSALKQPNCNCEVLQEKIKVQVEASEIKILNEIETKFVYQNKKVEESELKNFKMNLALVDRINDHKTDTKKLAKVFENNLFKYERRLAVLEKKDL